MDEEEKDIESKYWQRQLVDNCLICNGERTIISDKGTNLCKCTVTASVYTNLVANGVPKSFLDWKWSNCGKASPQIIKQCQDYIRDFDNNFISCRGMYIFGTQGVGKTTLSTMMAKYIALKINPITDRRYTVAFATYDTLVDWHTNKFNNILQDKLNKFITKAELVIIDNVGAEGGNVQNNTKLLDRILRERRNRGYPTIITSNYTMDEIKSNYSTSVRDFISQSFNEMPVIGQNIRAKEKVSDILAGIEDLGVED
jgi:DNA replication protein DnaC